MKIDFKPVRKRIDFGEYAPEHAGLGIDVHVNVTRDVMNRVYSVREKIRSVSAETPKEELPKIQEELYGVLRELWGAEAWPIEDIRQLHQQCKENDPQLWFWILNQTWLLLFGHQGLIKKN